MSASYGLMNYFGLLFALGLCWFLVSAGFIIVGFRWRKQGRSESQRNRLVFVHIIVQAVFFFLLLMSFLPVIDDVGDLLMPNMYEVRKTAGTVEYIMPVEHPDVFYSKGEFHGSAEFYIGGCTYYGICDGGLQKGMTVELDYAHGEHEDVILSWLEVTPEQVTATLAEAKQYKVQEEPAPQEEPSKAAPTAVSIELEQVLIRIQKISIAVFIGMIALQTWLNNLKRPYGWNHRQDHRIKSNWAIGGFRFLQFGCVHICILCAIFRGMKYGSLKGASMFVALILFHLSYFLYDLTRRMEIDGEVITVSYLWVQRQYTTSEIREVKWVIMRKWQHGFPGDAVPFEDWERVIDTYYALTVTFTDGKRYRFPVDTHLGVRSAYEELAKRLERRGGMPLEET